MKKRLLTTGFGLACVLIGQAALARNDWENELVFEKNKLEARVPAYSFGNAADALEGNSLTARPRARS